MRELVVLGIIGLLLLGAMMAIVEREPDDIFEKTCLEGVAYWYNKGNGYGPVLAPAINAETLLPEKCK